MKIRYAVIGSGWRSEFYLRIAQKNPDLFEVVGVVTRNQEKAEQFRHRFGVDVFATYDELQEGALHDFVVVCIKNPASEVTLSLLQQDRAVLIETPAGNDIEALVAFNTQIPKGAKIQVAEQYFLQPLHAARLAFLENEKIGTPVQAQISCTQGHHAVSLMRKYLHIGFENATIWAQKFTVPVIGGFTREGAPKKEEILQKSQLIATIAFDGKLGVIDFENDQHRSFVRSQRIQVKGVRGELNNLDIKYMKDFQTPIEARFIRKNLGENENLEGVGLKGIIAEDGWVYKNPFLNVALSDDEIAVADCLLKMDDYVHGGASFYSFAEASQDAYLSLLMNRSADTGMPVQTKTQVWAHPYLRT